MISIILDLIKTGFGFFQKKEQSKSESTAQTNHEQNQITLEETRQGFTWRQCLGYVLAFIIAWNYVIVPVLDYFGIVIFSLPLGQIFQVLILLLGGS
ncbi:hypothetical protein [Pseudescherichia sp.]|uniref:hypothetical protein n=1 Tax=Pseudescherichia sp. TaxID=2055881 RepID=UPI002899ABCB|nr:hypothetical protein [Pseudescherichia sp.]